MIFFLQAYFISAHHMPNKSYFIFSQEIDCLEHYVQ